MAGTGTTSDFAVSLPSDVAYVITRTFRAPRELVFEALTTPEHMARWLGPCDHTMTSCEVDLRVGGAYRWVERGEDGSEHPFKGEYREIAPPERLVYTWIYDVAPFDVHTAVISVVLEESAGRTAMTCVTTCESREVRDAIIASGMEHGARESYDRLDGLLHTMR